MMSTTSTAVVATLVVLMSLSSVAGRFDSNTDAAVEMQMNNQKVKVFGLGLSKTGTTSMGGALEQLGYKTLHTDQSLAPFMHHATSPVDLTGYYDDVDSVWDIPTAAYYRQLLTAYPNAKFILTTRDSNIWYESFMEYLEEYMYYSWGCGYPERIQRLHEFVYGSRTPNNEWINAFEKHNDDVISFFTEHAPEQLLVVDIEETDKWGKLCAFLGNNEGPCASDAVTSFPHSNIAEYHNVKKECSNDVTALGNNKNDKYAYVSLLCDPSGEDGAEYIRMLLVLGESIRQFDQKNDIVVMVHGSIDDEQMTLLAQEGVKIVMVDSVGSMVSHPEKLRVPDDVSACYRAKINVLQLTQYEKVIFLDNDLLVKQDLRFMFHQFGFLGFEGHESPLNTGLFSVTPSKQAFNDINDIAKSDSFHPEDGWLSYGRFPHWRLEGKTSDWSFWCAHTDQGILYYYYDKVAMQASIFSRYDGEELYTHFTGRTKPSLYERDNLMDGKVREEMLEWYRLSDRVDARVQARGAVVAPVNVDKSQKRVSRTLQMDPYAYEDTEDADCDPEEEVSLELWNADTDMMIGPLGDVIDLCLYGDSGLTIVAMPECKEKVKFKLLNSTEDQVYKNTEGVAPLSMGGDEGDDLYEVPELHVVGEYYLQINPVPGEKVDFYFEIVDDC